MADHDPSTPAKVDPNTRIPGLLDQYRQQRRAWLAQADELVRMREDVRQAAEREAIEIVTAARRDVRRIIVEARRELLVLTAQLHAAVEATDVEGIEAASFTGLLADPESRARVEIASHDTDITSDVVHEARRGVRSVLDEARAEIEALSAEAPAIFAQGPPSAPAAGRPHDVAVTDPDTTSEEEMREGPVHELSLDASLAALDFQTRDLPIPTLARLLGSERFDETPSRPGDGLAAAEPPLTYETPRLSELRSLLRDSVAPVDPVETIAPADTQPAAGRSAPTPDVEPAARTPFAFDTTPRTDFFADGPGTAQEPAQAVAAAVEPGANEEAPRFTPPSRLFGEDEPPSSARSARTFVGLFAATGALAVAGTLWWALSRDSAPLSAAAPPVITEKPAAAPAATTPAPAVAQTPPGTLALTIEARRPSWIRAQIDGKNETGRIYQAGETRHIYGARTVSIRAGDAGGVFVGVDGGTARPLGADGAATTRQFSAAVAPAAATGETAPLSLADATGATTAVADARTRAAEPSAAAARSQAPLPAAPSPAPASRPAAAPGAPEAAGREGITGGRPDLVQAAQQWLDAYQRRDRDTMNAMATDSVTVSDERSVTERFPAWQGGVQRELDEVALELTGDVAVFTARMTERADAVGGQHVSRVSQFWQRRTGRWYVTNVRIIGEARLNQIIR